MHTNHVRLSLWSSDDICECVPLFTVRSFHRTSSTTARTSDRLRLSEKLDDKALNILVRSGLQKRFPRECSQWEHESNAIQRLSESRIKTEIEKMTTKLQTELPALEKSLFEAILDEVLRLYP